MTRVGERGIASVDFRAFAIIEMPANALVLLAEGAEEMETVITVDVLRHKLIL